MKSKLRNNRHAQAPRTHILVGTGDQAVKTSGNLNTTGNTVNIANGQLGFLSTGHDSSIGANVFITAGTLTNATPEAAIVQGTANSGNLSAVNSMGASVKAYESSTPIYADEVVRVRTDLYKVPTLSMQFLDSFKTVEVGEEYTAYVNLESRLRDIEYTKTKRDQRVAASVATDNSTAARNLDYVLQDLAVKLNSQSEICGGTRPFMVLGIDTGGDSSGTALGSLAAGDTIDIAVIGGVTYTYTVTDEFVAAITAAIADTAGLSTDEVVTLNLANAGADAVTNQIDSLLVVGLNEQEAVAYDDNFQYKVKATMATDLLATTVTDLDDTFVSRATEDQLSGKFLKRYWEKEVSPYVFDLTYVSHPYDINSNTISGLNPFDSSLNYTRTVIEYFSITPENGERVAQSVEVYLPCAVSNPTADADTGYTVATTATTTVTQLNASIGAWLGDASDKYNKIEYQGSATKAAPFV